ncbi:MAG: hypothetical protein ACK5KR_07990 [Breznakia sp.]
MTENDIQKTTVMEKFFNGFSKVGGAIGKQKHIASVRDSFAVFVPFIIIGSMATLFTAVLLDPNGILAVKVFQDLFGINSNSGFFDI